MDDALNDLLNAIEADNDDEDYAPEITFIEWVDATYGSGWESIDAHQPIATIWSVGMVVDETDDYVTIAASVDEDMEMSNGVMTIPTSAIVTRYELAAV